MENTKHISKKFLTSDSAMIIKTVKVSEKGQIAIPSDIRQEGGIRQGDTLLIMHDEGKILLEKIPSKLEDDFRDFLKHAETVAKKLWGNKQDEIWDRV